MVSNYLGQSQTRLPPQKKVESSANSEDLNISRLKTRKLVTKIHAKTKTLNNECSSETRRHITCLYVTRQYPWSNESAQKVLKHHPPFKVLTLWANQVKTAYIKKDISQHFPALRWLSSSYQRRHDVTTITCHIACVTDRLSARVFLLDLRSSTITSCYEKPMWNTRWRTTEMIL